MLQNKFLVFRTKNKKESTHTHVVLKPKGSPNHPSTGRGISKVWSTHSTQEDQRALTREDMPARALTPVSLSDATRPGSEGPARFRLCAIPESMVVPRAGAGGLAS